MTLWHHVFFQWTSLKIKMILISCLLCHFSDLWPQTRPKTCTITNISTSPEVLRGFKFTITPLRVCKLNRQGMLTPLARLATCSLPDVGTCCHIQLLFSPTANGSSTAGDPQHGTARQRRFWADTFYGRSFVFANFVPLFKIVFIKKNFGATPLTRYMLAR